MHHILLLVQSLGLQELCAERLCQRSFGSASWWPRNDQSNLLLWETGKVDLTISTWATVSPERKSVHAKYRSVAGLQQLLATPGHGLGRWLRGRDSYSWSNQMDPGGTVVELLPCSWSRRANHTEIWWQCAKKKKRTQKRRFLRAFLSQKKWHLMTAGGSLMPSQA